MITQGHEEKAIVEVDERLFSFHVCEADGQRIVKSLRKMAESENNELEWVYLRELAALIDFYLP